MGVAGLMIVGLLGGLALFDYMSSRVESEPEATHYTEPVPVAKKTVTQPVTPIEPVPEVKKRVAAPEVSAVRWISRHRSICRRVLWWRHGRPWKTLTPAVALGGISGRACVCCHAP